MYVKPARHRELRRGGRGASAIGQFTPLENQGNSPVVSMHCMDLSIYNLSIASFNCLTG